MIASYTKMANNWSKIFTKKETMDGEMLRYEDADRKVKDIKKPVVVLLTGLSFEAECEKRNIHVECSKNGCLQLRKRQGRLQNE